LKATQVTGKVVDHLINRSMVDFASLGVLLEQSIFPIDYDWLNEAFAPIIINLQSTILSISTTAG
jgi:hypothetical protein